MEYCHKNCKGCEEYPKAKDKKNCSTYKKKARIVKHSIYEMRKKAKVEDKYFDAINKTMDEYYGKL